MSACNRKKNNELEGKGRAEGRRYTILALGHSQELRRLS
jgi:hypothetical protein